MSKICRIRACELIPCASVLMCISVQDMNLEERGKGVRRGQEKERKGEGEEEGEYIKQSRCPPFAAAAVVVSSNHGHPFSCAYLMKRE